MYAYELAKPLKAYDLIQVDGEDDQYIRVKEEEFVNLFIQEKQHRKDF
jgi:hypothetical protein